MTFPQSHLLSRRHFCLCCIASTTFAATNGWLTPSEAFAEARGIVSLIKDSAAVSPIVTHQLRSNISVLPEARVEIEEAGITVHPARPPGARLAQGVGRLTPH